MRKEEGRKLLRKSDWIVIAVIVLICMGVLIWMSLPKQTADVKAQISADGKIVRTIDLASAEDGEFGIEENPKVHFQIQDHQIRFIDTDCPDKLCENVGFIDTPNQIAVCLPNRVSLKIVSGNAEAGVDAIVD